MYMIRADIKEVPMKILARMCVTSYEPVSPSRLDGFTLVGKTQDMVSYRAGGTLVVAYRGTDITNQSDISADISIIRGTFNKETPTDMRVGQAISEAGNVISGQSGVQDVIFTGHSLGGYLAIKAFRYFSKQFDGRVFFAGFNGAVGFSDFYLPGVDNRRLVHYRTPEDPVSIKTPYGFRVVNVKGRGKNVHSLDNFL